MYHKRFKGVRNVLLTVGYLVLLGLQSYHGYYHFSSLTAIRLAHATRRVIMPVVLKPSSPALRGPVRKALLLDKRFLQEHGVFVVSSSFRLPLTVDNVVQQEYQGLLYTRNVCNKCTSRGPPVFAM